MKKYWLILCVLFCTACVSVPEKIALPKDTRSVEFSSAKAPTTSIIGQKARWGGVIASVKNYADSTLLEIVNFPLTSSLRPKQGDETPGRFRLYFNGLLDPIIYKEGRSITAVGTVSDLEKGKIGEHEYNFPVLKDASVHLWKNVQRIDINLMQQPYRQYNDPFYWSRAHLNYNRPIIIRNTTPKSNTRSSNKTILPPLKKER